MSEDCNDSRQKFRNKGTNVQCKYKQNRYRKLKGKMLKCEIKKTYSRVVVIAFSTQHFQPGILGSLTSFWSAIFWSCIFT